MRVIAGTCRGRVLFAPPGLTTRPTSDRVKEALFSILTSRINFTDISVLDISAGSGSLGIEALSRGAGSCCFIESNLAVKVILEKNILNTCCKERSKVVTMGAIKALHTLAGLHQRFDLVLFDPPYSSDLYKHVPELLDNLALLAPGGILVAECSARNPLPVSYGSLKRFDRRVYGETSLEFFAVEGN
jgi:16S rRNA (guanine(966)-N(2))-methyltransferase RsmD